MSIILFDAQLADPSRNQSIDKNGVIFKLVVAMKRHFGKSYALREEDKRRFQQ